MGQAHCQHTQGLAEGRGQIFLGGHLSLHIAAWGALAPRIPSLPLKASWRVDGDLYSWTLGIWSKPGNLPNQGPNSWGEEGHGLSWSLPVGVLGMEGKTRHAPQEAAMTQKGRTGLPG